MGKILKLIAASAIILPMPIGVASAETTVSYGTYLPPTHVANTSGVNPMVERLEAETGGDLKFQLYLGGVVAKATAAVDSIRNGTVDAGMIVDNYVAKQLPHGILGTKLAVLGRDSIAMAGATNEFNLIACKDCINDQKKQDIMTMAYYSTSPFTIMCKEDLKTLEDFSGKKIRSSGAWSLMLDSFGAVPVNLTSDEIYEAMNRGQVDCTLGPPAFLKSYNLWDVAKNVLDTAVGTYHGGTVWAMNLNSWDALSTDQKSLLKKNMPMLVSDITFGYLAETDEVRKQSADKGVSFNEPGPSFAKAYDEYATKELQRVKDEAKGQGIENADELVDLYVSLVRKWEKIHQEEIKNDKQKFVEALNREIYSKVSW